MNDSRRANRTARRLWLELLEDRAMLSASFAIENPPDTDSNSKPVFDVPAGKDLYVPVVGDASDSTLSYSVSSSSLSVSASLLTASSANPELVLDVTGTESDGTAFSGVMKFQLFGNLAPVTVQHIVDLVNSGLYNSNPASFYRVIPGSGANNSGTLIQGGVLGPGNANPPTPTVQDEFNSALSFNSPGLLALANAGAANSGSSEIFMTSPTTSLANEYPYLNDSSAIFGILTDAAATSGPSDLFADIANAKVSGSSGGGGNYVTGVGFTASIVTSDSLDAVVRIAEPSTFTGEAAITVDSTGADSSTSTGSFDVNVLNPTSSAASTNAQIVLNPISDLSTSGVQPVSFTVIATTSLSNATFTVTDPGTFGDTLVPASDVSVSISPISGSPNTATVTLTPKSAVSQSTTLNLVMHATTTSGSQQFQDTLPFSLTIKPTFDLSGNVLTANGTSGADVFQASISDDSWTVTLNGISQTYANSDVTQVNFQGNGGGDESIIVGARGSETAAFMPGSVVVAGSGYLVNVQNVQTNYVYGSGASTAVMNAQAGQTNIFAATDGYSYIGDVAGTFLSFAVGFGTNYTYSGSGNSDLAYFYPTAGASYAATPTYSELEAGSVTSTAEGFSNDYAEATTSNPYTAFFYGSTGNDAFQATATYAYMSGGSGPSAFFNEAVGSSAAFAIGGGGSDTTYFTDLAGAGGNTLSAGQGFAQWTGPGGVQAATSGFGALYATAGGSGNKATLYDTSGNDLLSAGGNNATLFYSPGGYTSASGYNNVTAISSGGSDTEHETAALDFALTTVGSWTSV